MVKKNHRSGTIPSAPVKRQQIEVAASKKITSLPELFHWRNLGIVKAIEVEAE